MNCEICENKLQGSQRKYCSNKCKQKAHYYKVKNQPNTYHAQTKRARRRKIKLVILKGGACNRCRYDNNYAALEFHHIDESKKLFPLDSRRLANTTWSKLIKESEKCELLCANCHREHHNKEWNKNQVSEILNT